MGETYCVKEKKKDGGKEEGGREREMEREKIIQAGGYSSVGGVLVSWVWQHTPVSHCSGGGSRGNKGLSLPRNLGGTF